MTSVTALQSGAGRAVLMACLAAFGFAGMFACLKALGPGFSPVQTVFFRSAFAFIPLMPLMWHTGWDVVRTNRPWSHAKRVGAGLLSMGCFFYAVGYLPLAALTAVTFTMPLFLTLLSVPLLGERVGWRRAAATIVGFAGVLLIIRPGVGGVDWIYGIALVGAALYALAVVFVRQLGQTEPAIRTFFYYSFCSAVASGLVLPFVWVEPTLREWLLLITLGIVGGLAQYAMVEAYRHAAATIVAPFEYTQIVWATGLGILLFAEWPDWAVLAGATMVAGSGLYIWHRETRLARIARS